MARLTWLELVRMTDEELASVDIALVNLACAVGLPDFPENYIDRVIRRLDDWAELVRLGTASLFPHFHTNPEEYQNSEAFYRALVMVGVLMRNLGLRYNPAKIPENVPLDTADMFIHGALLGDGGTCATLSVVLAAVGRRLGYPIALMATRHHFYNRWTEGQPFNIEISGPGGLATPPDEYFRTGRFEMDDEEAKDCGYLRPLSAREELAGFLVQRGERLGAFGEYRQKLICFAHAYELSPVWPITLILDQTMRQWHEQLQRRMPPKPYFPALRITLPPRRFPHLREEFEREIIGHLAQERLLDNHELDRKWWEPARRGQKPIDMPEMMRVYHHWD